MRVLTSLSFRLALTYAVIFCVSVAALLGLYYWLEIQQPLDLAKDQVELEMNQLSRVHADEGQAALVEALNKRARAESARHPFHAFIDRDGKTLTANLPSWPERVSSGWVEIEADVYHNGEETDHDALLLDQQFRDGSRLLVGRDVEDIDDLLESLAEIAAWVIACTIVLSIAGGVTMSLAIHQRIDAVNRAARTVIAGDLSQRIPVRGNGDDFDRLAETLNLMLGRIEGLFEALRRVSDSVAHELRTPLTRLLARLEMIGSVEDPEHKQSLIDGAVSEAQRLHAIFEALLRISRIETGRHESRMQPTDVSALLEDVAEFYEPEAERRNLQLITEIDASLRALADPDLLFQAVSNLVDNAVKYSPENGRVVIAGEHRAVGLVISVTDTGIGMDPAEIDRVTERFYRSPAARSVAGDGLGLSLVSAVAQQHRAVLRFLHNRPGLRVELALPRPSEAS